MSVLSIPEVVLAILACLPASKHDDTSVRTLIACTKTSRVLREVAKTDSLWIKHFLARWTLPHIVDITERAWYELYCVRRATDDEVRFLLNVIITTPSKRRHAALALCDHGVLARDMLRTEMECRVPKAASGVYKAVQERRPGERWEVFGEEWVVGTGKREMDDKDEEKLDTREISPDWIQRRWWAKQVLGTIARFDGLSDMIHVLSLSQSNLTGIESARHFENGMIALSGLMGINTHEISRKYDSFAQSCKESLIQGRIEVDTTSSEFDLKRFSKGVCDWMRSQGFRKTQGDHSYDDLINSFPHAFMAANRSSVPISLVCTFVAITSRLGLLSAPVGVIGHVHAWIALPSYHQPDLGSSSSGDEIDWEDEQPLRSLHVDNLQVSQDLWRKFMKPSNAFQMVWRAAKELLFSVTELDIQSPTDVQTENSSRVLYASAMTLFLVNPLTPKAPEYLRLVIVAIVHYYPFDAEPILTMLLQFLSGIKTEDSQIPKMVTHIRNEITKLQVSNVVVKKRKKAKYWVGMIFRNVWLDELGLIIGWDEVCKTDGRTVIAAPGIDMLPRGRRQPFYKVLGPNGTSRYLAEEQMAPLPSLMRERHTPWDIAGAFMQHRMAVVEPAFARVEVNEELGRVWFVPSASTAEEYPDDTALGEEYMRKP
ncbi:hemimethylated DNA-binding domain protein [Ceratobasidium sp. AG-Ba]|nr:hemimethylated DNA-binding domain protein [Ceratobasidium sp. AG-Ba]